MQIGTLNHINYVALWHINTLCNYNCKYCFGHSKTEHPSVEKFSTDEIAKGFDRTGLKWWIGLSGGEPFLYPKFVDLVEKLTKNHWVHIDTNLSLDTDEFRKRIDPEKVIYIHCAFHLQEVEKRGGVTKFIDKVLALKESGFSTIISYITYPPILPKLDEFINLFRTNHLILQPKVFRGKYGKGLIKKKFPYAYTQEERAMISKYLSDPVTKNSLYAYPSYKGKLCSAGKNFIRIHPNGRVTRCMGEHTELGNIFEGKLSLFDTSKPCRAKFCKCLFLSHIGIVHGIPDYRKEFEQLIHLNDK